MTALFCGQPRPRAAARSDGWFVLDDFLPGDQPAATASQTEVFMEQQSGALFSWGLMQPQSVSVEQPESTVGTRGQSFCQP